MLSSSPGAPSGKLHVELQRRRRDAAIPKVSESTVGRGDTIIRRTRFAPVEPKQPYVDAQFAAIRLTLLQLPLQRPAKDSLWHTGHVADDEFNRACT